MRFRLRTLLIVLALGAAGLLTWWCMFQQNQRALAHYGSEAVQLMQEASLVQVINGEQTKVVDISKSPELSQMRSLLLDDGNYDWSASDPRSDATNFSIQFRNGNKSLTLFFDFENNTIQTYPDMTTAQLKRDAVKRWISLASRQFTVEQ